jgi:hypothetical protein
MDDEVTSSGGSADTITIDSSFGTSEDFQIDMSSPHYGLPSLTTAQISSLNWNSIGAVGSVGGPNIYGPMGGSGTYITTNGAGGHTWGNTYGSNTILTTNTGKPSMTVSGDAEFEGDIKWKGRKLSTLLEKIEGRLAILEEADPKKLEKFAALKKAYDHYKLLEKLIGDDIDNEDDK